MWSTERALHADVISMKATVAAQAAAAAAEDDDDDELEEDEEDLPPFESSQPSSFTL